MRRPLLLLVALAGAALFTAGLGLGASGGPPTLKLSAKLDARHETPAPKGAVSHASGLFTAYLSRNLTWRLVFSGLTGKAVAAHIHLGKPGVAGPVLVALCGPCASGAHGTLSTVPPAARIALTAGRAYVNVHTVRNKAGEIRGQVLAPGASAPPSTSSGGGYGQD